MAWRTRTSAIAQPMVTGLSQQDAARDKNGGARGPADPTIHSMLEWNPHVSKPRGEKRTEDLAWKIRVAALPRRRRHGASPSAATPNSGQDAFEAAFIWRSKASAPITCSQPCTTAGDSPWSQAREPEDRVPRRATDRYSNITQALHIIPPKIYPQIHIKAFGYNDGMGCGVEKNIPHEHGQFNDDSVPYWNPKLWRGGVPCPPVPAPGTRVSHPLWYTAASK